MAKATESAPADQADRSRRWFWLGLLVLAAAGALVRVGYIAADRADRPLGGDALFYHSSANLIADGHGFVNPYLYAQDGTLVQAADHPPAEAAYLALFSWLGLRSQTDHLYAGVLLGTLTIVVGGLAGRAIRGPRVGLLAAGLLAVYPNVWRHDGLAMAETPAMLATVLTLWLAYRFLDRPSLARLALTGAAVGLAALARSELVLLAPLVVLPLAVGGRGIRAGSRWRRALAGLGACAVVLAPWVVGNLVRLERPVLLSSQFELTAATANCDSTYYGGLVGYWDLACADRVLEEHGLRSQDPEAAPVLSAEARSYVSNHLSRVPAVVAIRLGRITGLYRPDQTAGIDVLFEGNTKSVAEAGRWTLYPMMLLAVAGAVVLRRQRIPIYPLLGPLVTVVVSVIVLYAATRFRAPADATMCVMAAAALDGAWRWLRGRSLTGRRPTADGSPGSAAPA